MKITKPWPDAAKTYTYVCGKNTHKIPDSLQQHPFIKVPVENLVATSTTHVSSLIALNEAEKLIGFPNLDYVSSEKVRQMIAEGKIMELSDKESLNFEKQLILNHKLLLV